MGTFYHVQVIVIHFLLKHNFVVKLVLLALPLVFMFVELFTFMTFPRNMLFSYEFKQFGRIVLRAFAMI